MTETSGHDHNPFQHRNFNEPESIGGSFDEDGNEKHTYIPAYAMPFVYLFQPSRYMKHTAIHLSGAALFLIIWMTGASTVIDSLQSKQIFGQTMVLNPKTWAQLFGFGLAGGILRGYVIYGLGGLWFRVRLWICGVREERWDTTARVYMSAGIAKHLVWLGIIGYAALMFDDIDDYLQNEGAISSYTTLALIMVSQIWSSFTLYAGARSVFDASRIWAIILYLVLPILTRIVAIGVIMAIAYIGTAVEPQLDSPSNFSGGSFKFEYPSNWSVTADEVIPGPETWVQIEPFIADAIIEFDIEYVGADEDLVETYLDSIRENSGMTISDDFVALDQFGKFTGHGSRYTATLDGSGYIIQIFQSPIREYVDAVIMTIVEESIADTVEPGINHIVQTMRFTDPYTIRPNLERTYTAKQDELQFDIPSNWWLTNTRGDDTTDDDGTIHPGSITMEAQTPGYGLFRVYIYNSDLGPRSELGISINSFSGTDRLDEEQLLDHWHGCEGFGATGKYTSELGMEWNVTILISELSDGRLIEFQSAYPIDYAMNYKPGYDLIEQTLKIDQSLIPKP